MHFRFLSWLLIGALAGVMSAVAQTPAAPSGVPTVVGGAELILVAKKSGRVEMTVGGTVTALENGAKVPQKAKINTFGDGSVVLVFSNGATTQLGADSELIIEEFLQDPFASDIKVAEISDEPSQSRTKLALNKGELVGNVKKLKYDKGSSFIVQTPVGAAGIRGTTFRIVFRPGGTGQAFFTLSTASGNVSFESLAPGGSQSGGTPGGQGQGQGQGQGNTPQPNATPEPTATGTGTVTGITVPQGQEIAITVNVTTNAQGQMVVTVLPPPPSSTTNVNAATLAAVTSAAAEIAVAVQQTVFTPAPSSGSASGTGSSGTSGTTGTTGSTGGTGSGQTTTSTNPTPTTTTNPTPTTTTVTGSNFTAEVTTTPPPATPPRIVPTQP